MSFSLFNALANFQDYINQILAKKLAMFVIGYMDDILIYNNEADHIDSLWWVFKQLRKDLLYANLKKCCFH